MSNKTEKKPKTPRERALSHLRGLIAAAAGATLGIGCSGPQEEDTSVPPVDTVPPPMETDDAGTEDQADGSVTQDEPIPEPPPVVCDPLPPPYEE